MKQFNELGLSDQALEAVARLGYEAPTPVQEQAIPLALEGRDLIAAAKTGTGKTAAFSLPSLDRLEHAKGGQGPLMLVVTPTRELAQQIGEVCTAIAARRTIASSPWWAGVSYTPHDQQAQAWRGRSSSPRRAASSTSWSRARCVSATWRCSCSTRPTACSTWAFGRP